MAPDRPHRPTATSPPAVPPFTVIPPDGLAAPVIVHLPHSATYLPDDVRADILLTDADLAAELLAMTDHRTDRLAADAGNLGATRFRNNWSRLAVDPERFDDPQREEMEEVGMGAVYTATSDRRQLRELTATARTDLLDRHFRPYHTAFTGQVDRMLTDHGTCTIIDLHSYPSEALPYELHTDGARPALDIGTDERHTPHWLRALVTDAARDHRLDAAANTPFSGTFVPLKHLGNPQVHAVMLELRRDGYLDERTARPHQGEQHLRRFCAAVIAATVQHCASRRR